MNKSLEALIGSEVDARQRELTKAERFDYRRLKQLEESSINDYVKFNVAKAGSPQRLAAFIHQLSPWNLQRGADTIADYGTSATQKTLDTLVHKLEYQGIFEAHDTIEVIRKRLTDGDA